MGFLKRWWNGELPAPPFKRDTLRRLVTMRGITNEQQEELFRLVLHGATYERAIELSGQYAQGGATFVYTVEEAKHPAADARDGGLEAK